MKFRGQKLFTLTRVVILTVTIFLISMVIFPTAVFQASKAGVNAWWNIVFPALLPFFISSELLMSYGVIQFMGVLMEPVMRPVFNLPGAASFVLAVGYTSGFPISASLAARLRKENLCTRFEAEKLMCFTNNASPLFLLVAVGVGMFHNARLGVLIALAHYAGNLLLGIFLRYYGRNDPEYRTSVICKGNLFRRASSEMRKAFNVNPRPFGKVLGDAITSSINKLLVIGGFVVIFAVIIKVSAITGLTTVISTVIGLIAVPLGFTDAAVESLSCGFFEITLGTKAASEAAAPLIEKVVATSMILGWSGVSVLAQVSAMISETDLRMGLFVICRFLHSLLAGIFCYLLLVSESVRSWLAQPTTVGGAAAQSLSWFGTLAYFSELCLYTLFIWAAVAAIVYIIGSLSVIRFKV